MDEKKQKLEALVQAHMKNQAQTGNVDWIMKSIQNRKKREEQDDEMRQQQKKKQHKQNMKMILRYYGYSGQRIRPMSMSTIDLDVR